MPSPLQQFLWLLSFLLQLGVVVSCLVRRDARRYFALAVYMFLNAVVSVGQYLIIRAYGFTSVEYRYFYYYTDSLLVIVLFLSIISLYRQVIEELSVSRYILGGAAGLLAATALFSLVVVNKSADHMATRFVVELGQNLYFVGLVLTYLLWGVVMGLRETRLRLLQFVFSLGVFFSLLAASYALRNMFPSLASALALISQLGSVFLAGSWLHAMARVPEGHRLATARLVMGAHQ